MSEPPQTVTMESIAPHTYDGIDRPVGATYEAEAQYVEVLRLKQFALPVEEATQRREVLAAAKRNHQGESPEAAGKAPTKPPSRRPGAGRE